MPDVLSWGGLFLRAFVVPVGASTALLLLLLRWRGADRVAGALSLAAGYFAGYFYAGYDEGWAPLVPTTAKDEWSWLPTLVLLAGLAPLLPMKGGPLRRGLTALTALLVAGATAWLLVPNYEAMQATRPYYVGGAVAALLILWAALDPLAERQPGGRVPLLLTCVAVAAAAVLLGAANLKLATLTGPLAGALTGAALVAYFNPDRRHLRGMVPGFAVLLVGLLLQGHLEASDEVPRLGFLLVLAAPLLLWVGGRGRWAGIIQTAAVLLPLAAAVLLAALSAEPGGSEEDWSTAPSERRGPPGVRHLAFSGSVPSASVPGTPPPVTGPAIGGPLAS
jgi:hypothetical protein